MNNNNVYWYLVKVILDAELAPHLYEQYLQSDDDLDLYGKWAFTHMCSIGLAAIIDYNLTFYPEKVTDVLKSHLTFENINDLKSYSRSMSIFKKKVEDILILEIQKNNLKPSSEKLELILGTTEQKLLITFKMFLEKAYA